MPGICWSRKRRPVTSKTACRRLDAVSSGAKNAEVPGVHVQLHHIPDIGAENIHILGLHGAGGLDVHGVVPEIGRTQVPQQQTAVGVGICTHAPAARRGEGGYQLHRRTVGVEQLLRPIGPQPRLQLARCLSVSAPMEIGT